MHVRAFTMNLIKSGVAIQKRHCEGDKNSRDHTGVLPLPTPVLESYLRPWFMH